MASPTLADQLRRTAKSVVLKDEAATTHLRFQERIDTKRTGTAAFLAVIVPGGYGYRREDGVDVIPRAALGP